MWLNQEKKNAKRREKARDNYVSDNYEKKNETQILSDLSDEDFVTKPRKERKKKGKGNRQYVSDDDMPVK